MENPLPEEEVSTKEALQKVEQLAAVSAPADFARQENGQEGQVAGQVKYAGFWMRWAANFIDGAVVFLVGGAVGFLLKLVLIVGGVLSLGGSEVAFGVLGWIVSMAISWSYYVYFTHTRHATLGKMLLGMEVRSAGKEDAYASLGEIILRETLGKILSTLTLGIGYLMVAFTARKRGLHDFVGSTVVVYKNPQAPRSRWVFWAIAAVASLVVLVIVGILASVVLVSISSARQKASDAAIKAVVTGEYARALAYVEEKGTFEGFEPKKTEIPSCEYAPEIKVSADGSSAFIFAKFCSGDGKYACVDSKGYKDAGKEILEDGVISCSAEKEESSAAQQAGASSQQEEISAEEMEKILAELDPELRSLDEANAPSVLIVSEEAREYAQKSGSYKGFVPSNSYPLDKPECTSILRADVSPNGRKIVVHRPLCSIEGASFCMEETDAEVMMSETEVVEKTYKCL